MVGGCKNKCQIVFSAQYVFRFLSRILVFLLPLLLFNIIIRFSLIFTIIDIRAVDMFVLAVK